MGLTVILWSYLEQAVYGLSVVQLIYLSTKHSKQAEIPGAATIHVSKILRLVTYPKYECHVHIQIHYAHSWIQMKLLNI